MEEAIFNLPPSKRFKLLHSLPAKKRHLPPPPTTTLLPAKKRIWAPHLLSPIKTLDPAGDGEKDDDNHDDDDDGINCAVCGSTDGDPSDPIVFCDGDGCGLTVHASCYGDPLRRSVPAGDWLCLRCSDPHPAGNPRCCLCPKPGGALKPTTDGRWAHILCALLVPEVFFADPAGKNEIDCSQIPPARWRLRCYLCGCRSGSGIECSELKCQLGFHVSCGIDAGLSIEYKEGGGKGGAAIVAGFCGDHTEIWKKQQLSGKFKIVAREKKELKRKKD